MGRIYLLSFVCLLLESEGNILRGMKTKRRRVKWREKKKKKKGARGKCCWESKALRTGFKGGFFVFLFFSSFFFPFYESCPRLLPSRAPKKKHNKFIIMKNSKRKNKKK
uniref:Uncharacterized protein n=1 Tax=Trypanosoma vivax (strain Y486) TaxID=1055687 RepID=G0UAD4_TRYVY|nr:hypothetical protein TVY486_1102520 [Trypanosoma vivax Y486]